MKNHIIKKLMLSIVLAGTAAPFTYGMRGSATITTLNIINLIKKCEEKISQSQFEQAHNNLNTILNAFKGNKHLITQETKTQWEILKNKTLTKQDVPDFKKKCQTIITHIDILLSNNVNTSVLLTRNLNNNNNKKIQKVPSKNSTPKIVAQENIKPKKIENNNQNNQKELVRNSYSQKQKEISNQSNKNVPLTIHVEIPTKNPAPKIAKQPEIIEQKVIENNPIEVKQPEIVEIKEIDDNKIDTPQVNNLIQVNHPEIPEIIEQEVIENNPIEVKQPEIVEIKEIDHNKIDTPQVNNLIQVNHPEIPEIIEQEVIENNLIEVKQPEIVEIKEIDHNKIDTPQVNNPIQVNQPEIVENVLAVENVLNDFIIDVIKNNKLKEPQNLTLEDKAHVTFLKFYAKELQKLKSIIELKQGAHISKKILDEAYYNLYRVKLLASEFDSNHVTVKTIASLFKNVFTTIINNVTLCVDTIKDIFAINSVIELVTLFKEICPQLNSDALEIKVKLRLETLNKDYTEELTEYEKETIKIDAQLEAKVKILIALFNDKKTEQNKEATTVTTSTVKNRSGLFTTASHNLIINALLDVLNVDKKEISKFNTLFINYNTKLLKAAEQALNYCSGKNYFNMINRYTLNKN